MQKNESRALCSIIHKSKNKLLGLHQNKNFHTEKETINNMKTQPTELEKILANDISNNELISKIYKELIQLNNAKTQIIQFKKEQST